MIRQRPGPQNSLGLVKIMFPNEHLVYLHDTPARTLFARDERAFSSGCIRIERPFDLVELLLDDPTTWNHAALDAVVAKGETRTITLQRPVPVVIDYWIAEVDEARPHRLQAPTSTIATRSCSRRWTARSPGVIAPFVARPPEAPALADTIRV